MQCKTKKNGFFSFKSSKTFDKLTGLLLADKVVSEFQTNDVFVIAQRLNISIVYEKWFPVTLGEFDRKNNRITVNQNANIAFEKIIAHEIGHYFLENLKQQKPDETFEDEKFCDEFAENLVGK